MLRRLWEQLGLKRALNRAFRDRSFSSPVEWALLLEVERAFRSLKQTLELRPMYHRKDERIRTHVTLCWLALLLIRTIEKETDQTWEKTRRVLERIHQGEFATKDGRILQRTELTCEQKQILKRLGIKPPAKVEKVELADP